MPRRRRQFPSAFPSTFGGSSLPVPASLQGLINDMAAPGPSRTFNYRTTHAVPYTLPGSQAPVSPDGTGTAAHANDMAARRLAEQTRERARKEAAKQRQEQQDADHLIDDAAAGDRDEDEELYAQYRPARLREGQPHPDPIVETASLASIEPPVPKYKHHLQDIVTQNLISAAQLETIIYANDRFEQRLPSGERAGFFLGDGAGVGKGRQIAALVRDQWELGRRRFLWVSVSSDLRLDAQRDLDDVNSGHIPLFPQGNSSVPKGKISKHLKQGVLFITYSLLVSGARSWAKQAAKDPEADESAQGTIDRNTRLGQIIEWLSEGQGDPVIVFDEAHKAKNLLVSSKGGGGTQTGLAVMRLQKCLPNACVVYSSATGASEPHNLAYMVRMSNAGFGTMKALIMYLKGAGLASLELYAMGLKATGAYLSRTLSYSGAEFNIAKEQIDPVFAEIYDRSCKFWSLLFFVCQHVDLGRTGWRVFWGAQLRFYRQMLMAAKVPACARLAQEAVANGMCAVIGLQSTGEANTKAAAEVDDTLDDFVSAPQVVLTSFLVKHFPVARPSKLSHQELRNLLGLTWEAIDTWRQSGTAEEAAAVASAPTSGAAPASAAAPSRPARTSTQANASAAAADDDDEDEVIGVTEITLEQKLERKRLDAMQAGRFLDLSSEVDIEPALAGLARDEEEERNKQLTAALSPILKRQADAIAAVKAAQEGMRKAEEEAAAEKAAKEATAEAADRPSGGRLQRRAGTTPTKSPQQQSEDADMDDAEAPAQQQGQAGRKRAHVLDESDEESDNEMASADKASPASKIQKTTASADKSSPAPADDVAEDDSAEPTEAQEGPVGSRRKAGSAQGKQRKEPSPTDSSDCVVILPPSTARGARARRSASKEDSEDDDEVAVSSPRRKRPAVKAEVKSEGKSKAAAKGKGKAAAAKGKGKKGKKPAAKSRGGKKKRKAALTSDSSSEEESESSTSMSDESDDSDDDSSDDEVEVIEDLVSEDSDFKQQVKRASKAAQGRGAVASRTRNAAQMTLEGAFRRIGGKTMTLKEQAARRTLLEAQKELREADADLEDTKARVTGDDGVDSEEEGTQDYTASHGSAGRSRGKTAAKKERKPAMPQYAVKRQELEEGWDEGMDDDASDEDLIQGMDDNMLGDEGAPPSKQMQRLRRMLLRAVNALELPPNPLDHLTELCGGADKVAEMTGRQAMLVRQDDGKVKYQQRRADEAQKMVNIREKESFMRGDKLVAIISEAASVGISLQADKRVGNQKRRCHLTLELPWSADKAVQQFGRSHRSNQTSAPIYRIIVTACGGEFRFAASAAKRLQSLGALLRGDRRALGAGVDLKEFDIDNKFGKQALDRTVGIIVGTRAPVDSVQVPVLPEEVRQLLPSNLDDEQAFNRYMQDAMIPVGLIDRDSRNRCTVSKSAETVSTFLNRMLALPLGQQELLFDFFSAVMDALIDEAKSSGKHDDGIISIKAQGAKIRSQETIHVDEASGAHTYHTVVEVNRGLSWQAAVKFRDECDAEMAARGSSSSRNVGFFKERCTDFGKTGHPRVLIASDIRSSNQRGQRKVRVQRPNSTILPLMDEDSLRANYTKMTDVEAKRHWEFWYAWVADKCMHGAVCTQRKVGKKCTFGTRHTDLHLINGAVLPLLKCLEHVVSRSLHGRNAEGKKQMPRVVRTVLDNGTPLLGLSLIEQDAKLVKDQVVTVFGHPPVNGARTAQQASVGPDALVSVPGASGVRTESLPQGTKWAAPSAAASRAPAAAVAKPAPTIIELD
ncbi:hypothetical protein WJX73_001795 [Symbiochloris irregularis]|uniref:Uncharacterized protein n=1 Tax=Symbiochloris irregularis TaxID=706552 RepID=A0AAW1PF74_9CHLO